MGEWLESLPVGWMALVVFTLTYLTAWAIFAIVTRLAAGERTAVFKGISRRHAASARHHLRPAGRVCRIPGLE